MATCLAERKECKGDKMWADKIRKEKKKKLKRKEEKRKNGINRKNEEILEKILNEEMKDSIVQWSKTKN